MPLGQRSRIVRHIEQKLCMQLRNFIWRVSLNYQHMILFSCSMCYVSDLIRNIGFNIVTRLSILHHIAMLSQIQSPSSRLTLKRSRSAFAIQIFRIFYKITFFVTCSANKYINDCGKGSHRVGTKKAFWRLGKQASTRFCETLTPVWTHRNWSSKLITTSQTICRLLKFS